MPRFEFWPFVAYGVDLVERMVLAVVTYLAIHPIAFVAFVLFAVAGLLIACLYVFGSAMQSMDAAERGVVVPFEGHEPRPIRRVPITDRAEYARLLAEAEGSWDRARAETQARVRRTSSGSEVA